MGSKVIVLAALILCTNVISNAADETSCPEPPKHYVELGCRPITDEGHKCPTRYECPKLTDRDGNKCYFNGNVYEQGARLSKADQDVISCAPACRCNEGGSFVCAHIDCPEYFDRQEGCIYQYKPTDCCASNMVCDDEVDKLAECYIDGERYLEGQSMYPKDKSCYKCQCKKGFDNSTIVDNPNCYEINCGIELHNSAALKQGCIPVYFGNNHCCPISWRCPEDNDKVVVEGRLGQNVDQKPEMQCKFGNLKLNIGDSISSNDKCVSCKCTIPPMAHCISSSDCE